MKRPDYCSFEIFRDFQKQACKRTQKARKEFLNQERNNFAPIRVYSRAKKGISLLTDNSA